MKNKISKFLLIFTLLIITSCASRKELVYFQGEQNSFTKYEEYIPKIQSSDMLAISISAADIKATEPFNQQSIYQLIQLQPRIIHMQKFTLSTKMGLSITLFWVR